MDHDLVDLAAEYFGLTREEVVAAAESHATINRLQWGECAGATWHERVQHFYRVADGCVFEQLHRTGSKAQLRRRYEQLGHWPWLRRSGRDVLEFGAGLGATCSLLRDLRRTVTYVDVDGAASQFARWYFARTAQLDIEVVLTPPDRLELPAGRDWDLVLAESVMGRIADPCRTLDRLADAVRPGGMLVWIDDLNRVGPRSPIERAVGVDELVAGAPALHRFERVAHRTAGCNVFRRPAAASASRRRTSRASAS